MRGLAPRTSNRRLFLLMPQNAGGDRSAWHIFEVRIIEFSLNGNSVDSIESR